MIHRFVSVAGAALIWTGLATAVGLGATARADTASSAAKTATLQHDVDALVAQGAPGVVLYTRNGNKTVGLTGGYGEVESKTPMRVDDRFRVASLAKTYTAVVVLQLVGEGKLRLGDTVERWLPGLVPGGEDITIRQLLNHTSGLADFEVDPVVLAPYLSGDFGHPWDPRDLVEIAVSHPPLFAPGKGESYSSTNYVLAGLIVEASTGKTFGSELTQRILRPLHLSATSFPLTPALPSPHAHGYLVLQDPPADDVTGLYPFPWAAGALVSTAADTATFYRALLRGTLLSPKLMRAMEVTHPQEHIDVPGQRYGLGLMSFPTPCGLAWGHSGSFPGYYLYNYTSSDGKRQAVIQVNEDPSSLSATARASYLRLLVRAYCSQ